MYELMGKKILTILHLIILLIRFLLMPLNHHVFENIMENGAFAH